jgi:hypothetical protein
MTAQKERNLCKMEKKLFDIEKNKNIKTKWNRAKADAHYCCGIFQYMRILCFSPLSLTHSLQSQFEALKLSSGCTLMS